MVLVLLLTVHLLCVNVCSAGPLVCVWLDWRAGRGDRLARATCRFLADLALVMLIVGAVLGLAVGWLLWSDGYRQVLARFPSKIFFGVWELVFSLVLLVVYAWWCRAEKNTAAGRWGRGFVALLAATNLMYHFPFLLAAISDVASGNGPAEEFINAAVFRRIMAQGHILAQTTHFLLASFAVTGTLLIARSWHMLAEPQTEPKPAETKPGREPADAKRLAVWGGRLALVPTVLQIPVGIWLLLQLPKSVQTRLMGDDMLASGLLGVSLVVAMALLHKLGAISFGDVRRRDLGVTVAMMLGIVFAMTAVLHHTKQRENPAAQRTAYEVPQDSNREANHD